MLVTTACGGGDAPSRVEGVVIDVDGDLLEVRAFTVLSEDGDRITFVPRDGLRFSHGAPLPHLREHVTFGTAVVVDYRDDGGRLVAIELRDG